MENERLNIWEERDPKIHMRYDDKIYSMSASRRIFFGLTLFVLVPTLIVAITSILLQIFAPSVFLTIINNGTLNILFSSFCIYVIGSLVFYVCVAGTRTRYRRKTKLGAENFIFLLLIIQFFSIVGLLVGSSISNAVFLLLGSDTTGAVSGMTSSAPLLALFLHFVILAPIFEELVFRKLMLDRLSYYGDKLAIVVSALAFGAFHGNFEQFFYTFAAGVIWGYVYTKTGRLRYSIFMHMLMNFFNTIIPTYISQFDPQSHILQYLGLATLRFGAAVAGLVLFIFALVKGWYKIETEPVVYIPKRRLPRFLFLNVSAWLYIAACALLFLSFYLPAA